MSRYFSCLILSCFCLFSQVRNISLYRFVSLGQPESVTPMSSFSVLNYVFLHFTVITRHPRKLESCSNQAVSLITIQNPPLQGLMIFGFPASVVNSWGTSVKPSNPGWPFTHSPSPLGSQDPTTLIFRLCWLFLFSSLSGSTSLNIRCLRDQFLNFLSSLATLTYSLGMIWSKAHDFTWLITFNFIWTADLYFQLPTTFSTCVMNK